MPLPTYTTTVMNPRTAEQLPVVDDMPTRPDDADSLATFLRFAVHAFYGPDPAPMAPLAVEADRVQYWGAARGQGVIGSAANSYSTKRPDSYFNFHYSTHLAWHLIETAVTAASTVRVDGLDATVVDWIGGERGHFVPPGRGGEVWPWPLELGGRRIQVPSWEPLMPELDDPRWRDSQPKDDRMGWSGLSFNSFAGWMLAGFDRADLWRYAEQVRRTEGGGPKRAKDTAALLPGALATVQRIYDGMQIALTDVEASPPPGQITAPTPRRNTWR